MLQELTASEVKAAAAAESALLIGNGNLCAGVKQLS